MSTSRATFEMEVGRIYWRQIRDFVSRAKFEGRDLALWESRGIVSRMFVLRGNARDIEWARNCLHRWVAAMEADEGKP